LTTPEGDPLVFTVARYRHAAREEIRALLEGTEDFEMEEPVGEAPDEALLFTWFETRPDAPPQHVPVGRRVLAQLTLTEATLLVEAFSARRLKDCRRRVQRLLGERIELERIEVKDVEEALRHRPPGEAGEPYVPPPEVVAEMEEQMVRQWIETSIPALDGATPREAVKTPEGREQVRALLDHIARSQRGPKPPGMFSPDYRRAKELLGLEE
jgi:hypothetical protein